MANHKEFEKLNDTNYNIWKYRMEMLLLKMDLWDIVSGEEEEPTTGPNSKTMKSYRKRQQAARAEIALRVEDNQLIYTKNTDPAEIWTKLETVHRARGMATRMAMQREFHIMQKSAEENMQAWIARVQDAAQQLRELGAKIDDEEEILVLTQALGMEYETLIVSLDGQTDLTLETTITRLLNEALRQGEESSIVRHKSENAAHLAQRGKGTNWTKTPVDRITCFGCGKKGHYQRDCPENRDPQPDTSNIVNGALTDVAF